MWLWQKPSCSKRETLLMKKSETTGENIVFELRQAVIGAPIASIFRNMGLTETNYIP
jgi:hypothetical protein